jgi:hypothetical protein
MRTRRLSAVGEGESTRARLGAHHADHLRLGLLAHVLPVRQLVLGVQAVEAQVAFESKRLETIFSGFRV